MLNLVGVLNLGGVFKLLSYLDLQFQSSFQTCQPWGLQGEAWRFGTFKVGRIREPFEVMVLRTCSRIEFIYMD